MRFRLLAFVLVLACSAFAQQPDAQQIVTKEFGSSFTVVPGFPPMVGDIDHDGTEDMIIVVTSKNPLIDENEFHYHAIDPYDSFWGFGDPHDTIRFSATDSGPTRYLAILHNWRAPKAKFVVINLPFDKIGLSRVEYKKKAVMSVHTTEAGGLESDLFWDGKKYKWEPGYVNQ